MGDSWADRLGRRVAESALKAVKVAVDNMPNEITDFALSPQAIAKLIVMAERNHLLDDPKAEGLRDVAHRIAAGETVSTDELLETLPEIARMDLIKRVIPDPVLADKIAKAADKVVAANRLRKLASGLGGAFGTPTRTPQKSAPEADIPPASVPPSVEPTVAADPSGPAPTPRPRRTRTTAPKASQATGTAAEQAQRAIDQAKQAKSRRTRGGPPKGPTGVE